MRASALALLLAVVGGTAGCGGGGAARVEAAPDRFVGMERRALNACAGPPTAVEPAADGGTLLVYRMSSSRRVEIARPDSGPGRPGSVGSSLPPPPSTVYRRDCAASFLVREGRVVAAEFQGIGAGGQEAPEACDAFVQRCLKAR